MPEQLDWNIIAPHPSNVLIAGDVGTGKTALAGTYVDYARGKGLYLYSVGRSFPHCKTVKDTYAPPNNSVILVDDAHLTDLYAHSSSPAQTMYDRLQRQKRHNRVSIVYTTQDTTGFTLRLIRMQDAICLFQPNMMGYDYERAKIRTRYTKASRALEPYKGEYGYVWIQWKDRETHQVSEDVYRFSLPSWWTESISTEGTFKKKRDYTPLRDASKGILDGVRTIGRLFG